MKEQVLNWGDQFDTCCFLDNHQYSSGHHSIECILAAGEQHRFAANAGAALAGVSDFYRRHGDWIFGHLGYDLKNELENLRSDRPDRIGLPDLFFFVPQVVIQVKADELRIGSLQQDPTEIFQSIVAAADRARGLSANPPDNLAPIGRSGVHPAHREEPSPRQPDGLALRRPSRLPPGSPSPQLNISSRFSRSEYVERVGQLKQHILRGDCYEVNFCQEFYAEQADIEPSKLYSRLADTSPNPFSAYYKHNGRYLLCMSPERYLRKEGARILSQPIKGTATRVPDDTVQDAANARQLAESEKERAENIMVVDLVRNDLSRICEQGTVQVDELCGIYSFPQVHQMISTVSGVLRQGLDWTDAIRASFPMGSMTGAPKKRVMELIEQYELTRRGLFSGSVGYVAPGGDFDFNVVIRSVLYNKGDRYLSFHTGSAITFGSDADSEYEECLLKAAAIKKALA